MSSVTVGQIAANFESVLTRVESAGGDKDRVRIVAVTKGFDSDVARAAIDAGLLDLGENYAQEMLAKSALFDELSAGHPVAPRWHFLGRLQRNKVRPMASRVALWQSVDRVELIDEIAKRAPGAAVLIQINLSNDDHKGGCSFADAPSLVDAAVGRGLEVRGLMGVGPGGESPSEGFHRLVALADELDLRERSIGMSDDYEAAVRAGSTMIRIGRGLFGDRPPRA